MHHPPADMPHRPRKSRPRGFSLVELLVVISIMALVIAATIPALNIMQQTSVTSSGVNTISVAAEVARRLATGNESKKDPLSAGSPISGAAVLVTNTGTIRILENKGNTGIGVSFSTPLSPDERNGFADIAGRDYISIPSRVALLGIRRNGANANNLSFVAPPFAIRFNEHGSLIYGDVGSANGFYDVYYDGDYDGVYESTSSRPSPYDPFDSSNQIWNSSQDKYELPFEQIETVVGVMIVDRQDVPDLTGSTTGSSNNGYIGSSDAAFSAIRDNGVPVFFNRYTGAPVSH